jgi:hypothetical protein
MLANCPQSCNQLVTITIPTTTASSNYLDLVGNLKLRSTSIVNGNLIINNNNDK